MTAAELMRLLDPSHKTIEQLEEEDDDDSTLGSNESHPVLPPVQGLLRRVSLDLFFEWEAWDGHWDPFHGKPWPSWWHHDARQIRLARSHLRKPAEDRARRDLWARELMRTRLFTSHAGETHG